MGRQANPANGPLANEKLLAAVFSEDSVKNKRNTEAVEIAPNTLVAARIVDYKPATLQPFDSVKGSIETLLKRQEAQALARKDGEARLEALRKGEDSLGWGAVKSVSRLDPRQIPPACRTDRLQDGCQQAAGLRRRRPAWRRLCAVQAGQSRMPARRSTMRRKQAMLRQLNTLAAQEEVQSYLAALRSRYKVEINTAALESQDK